MPTDPRHRRRIPSGRRVGRVIAQLYRAMLAEARRAVLARRDPDLSAFGPAAARELLPLLLHEYALGRHQVQRELNTPVQLAGRKGMSGRLRAKGAPLSLPGVDFALFRLEVPAAVQRLVLDLAGSVTDTLRQAVRDELDAGLRAGEPVAEIAGRLGGLFAPRRAYLVAQTEASRAMHAGEADAGKEMGAAGLEWLASSDACDVCQGLNGKRVRYGEPFLVHPKGSPAYRAVYHPPAHPHCYCSTLTWWGEDERAIRRA